MSRARLLLPILIGSFVESLRCIEAAASSHERPAAHSRDKQLPDTMSPQSSDCESSAPSSITSQRSRKRHGIQQSGNNRSAARAPSSSDESESSASSSASSYKSSGERNRMRIQRARLLLERERLLEEDPSRKTPRDAARDEKDRLRMDQFQKDREEKMRQQELRHKNADDALRQEAEEVRLDREIDEVRKLKEKEIDEVRKLKEKQIRLEIELSRAKEEKENGRAVVESKAEANRVVAAKVKGQGFDSTHLQQQNLLTRATRWITRARGRRRQQDSICVGY